MNKFLLVSFAVILISCSDSGEELLNSEPVPSGSSKSEYLTFNEALEFSAKALQEFSAEELVSRTSVFDYNKGTVNLLCNPMCSRSQQADSTFYVVNFEDGGAVLLAANRKIRNKVYGLPPDGKFETVPNPALRVYLDWAYLDAHEAANDTVNNGIFRAPVDPNPKPDLFKVINGVPCTGTAGRTMTTRDGKTGITEWGQKGAYGEYASNGVAGCVAVAMGQILAYFKGPVAINGRSLNWDEMLAKPSFYFSWESGADDVAFLLRELGELVNMQYNTDPLESGAFSSEVPGAFRKLGFTSSNLERFSVNKCVDHINYLSLDGPAPPLGSPTYGSPIYMRGTADGSGGHAWTVEAYTKVSTRYDFYRQDNGEFYTTEYYNDIQLYMNWGYDGYSNGYYKSPGTYMVGNITFDDNFQVVYVDW